MPAFYKKNCYLTGIIQIMKNLLTAAFLATFAWPAVAAEATPAIAAAALAAAEAAAEAAAAAAAAAKAAVAAAKAAIAASAAPAQAAAPASAPVATTVSAVAPQAFAKSSKNFLGPYVGLFADLKSSTFKLSGAVNGTSATFDGVGQQSVNGHVEGGYGFSVGQKMVLTAGATYDLASTTLAKLSFSTFQGSVAEVNAKQTRAYSIFLAPGYKTSEDTLVFAKLAYHHSNVESLASGTNTKGTSGAQTNSFGGVSGFGYGLGIKTMLTKQTWLSVEAMRVDYNQFTVFSGANGTTGTTIGSMGIGYNFY